MPFDSQTHTSVHARWLYCIFYCMAASGVSRIARPGSCKTQSRTPALGSGLTRQAHTVSTHLVHAKHRACGSVRYKGTIHGHGYNHDANRESRCVSFEFHTARIVSCMPNKTRLSARQFGKGYRRRVCIVELSHLCFSTKACSRSGQIDDNRSAHLLAEGAPDPSHHLGVLDDRLAGPFP